MIRSLKSAWKALRVEMKARRQAEFQLLVDDCFRGRRARARAGLATRPVEHEEARARFTAAAAS